MKPASVALVLLILSGCSPKDTASKELFKSVIDSALIEHPRQVCDTPRNITGLPSNYSGTNVYTKKDIPAQFANAVKLGYLNVMAQPGQTQEGFQVYRVEQTAKLKTLLLGKNNTVCAGTLQLMSVGDFSVPGEQFGMTVSQVNITVQYTSVPDWAKNRALLTELGLFSLASADLASTRPQLKQVKMILKNSGWVVTGL